MGLFNKVKSGGKKLLKGLENKKPSVDPASTLTPEQQAQLSALSSQNIANYPMMYSALGGLAYNPQSNYSRLNNWESEFNTGVVNPMTSKMNELIADTRHSSSLHSSANRFAQDKIKQDTLNNLAGLRYDQLMKERAMELQGLDDSQQRQLSALGELSNLSSQALGVNGVENIVNKKRDWMDYATFGVSAIGALK